MIIEILRCLKHARGKKFYSETGEDAIVLNYLSNEKGRYLDIGASHPIIGNNTYFLYVRGWNGIAIEPIESYRKIWHFIRKRDKFINAVVAENVERKTFYEFENPLLSTLDKNIAEFHSERGKKFNSYNVDSVTLFNLLPINLSPKDNFLLNIDVEGAEVDVLKSNDFQLKRPKFITIESWSLPWEKESEAIRFLREKAGYTLLAYTGLTALMVPQEILHELRGLRTSLGKIS